MGKYSDILKQQKPSGKYSQMMAQAQPAVGGGIGSSYQKMGETILEKASEVGSSIGEKFQDAAEQFRQGDILAGVGAGGRAGLQTLMSPISVATEVVKETPLKPVVEIAELPFQAIDKGFRAVSGAHIDALRGVGVPISDKAKEELTGLASEAGTLAITPKLPKIAKETAKIATRPVAKPVGKAARTIEAVAQKPKFEESKGLEVFDRQVSTTLRENLSPSRKGIEKVNNLLEDLNLTAKPKIAQATQQGVTIDFQALKEVVSSGKDKLKNSATRLEGEKAIDDMISRIDDVASRYPNGDVPFDAAWEFKRSLQKIASGKFDKEAPLRAEMAKEVQHVLLDDMVSKRPELHEIGMRQRDLIEASDMMGRRVAQREGTRLESRLVRFGIGAGAGAGAGTLLGVPYVGAALGVLAESPKVQHGVAVVLDRFAKGGRGKSPYKDYKATPLPPRANQQQGANQPPPNPHQGGQPTTPQGGNPTIGNPPSGSTPPPVSNQPTPSGTQSGTPVPQFTQPSNVDLVYNELNKRGLKGLAYSYKSGERLTMPERKIVEQVEDGILYPQESPKLDLSTGLPPVNAIGAEFRKANPIDDKISAYRKPIEDKLIEKGETPENLAKLDDTELVKLAEEKEAYIPPPVGEIGAVTKAGKPITEVLANDKEGNTVVASKLEEKMNADKTAEQIAQESLDAKAMKYFGKKFDKLTTAEIIEMRKRK